MRLQAGLIVVPIVSLVTPKMKKEKVDDQSSMVDGLSSEMVAVFRIRRAYYGKHFPVLVEYRCIKHPI